MPTEEEKLIQVYAVNFGERGHALIRQCIFGWQSHNGNTDPDTRMWEYVLHEDRPFDTLHPDTLFFGSGEDVKNFVTHNTATDDLGWEWSGIMDLVYVLRTEKGWLLCISQIDPMEADEPVTMVYCGSDEEYEEPHWNFLTDINAPPEKVVYFQDMTSAWEFLESHTWDYKWIWAGEGTLVYYIEIHGKLYPCLIDLEDSQYLIVKLRMIPSDMLLGWIEFGIGKSDDMMSFAEKHELHHFIMEEASIHGWLYIGPIVVWNECNQYWHYPV